MTDWIIVVFIEADGTIFSVFFFKQKTKISIDISLFTVIDSYKLKTCYVDRLTQTKLIKLPILLIIIFDKFLFVHPLVLLIFLHKEKIFLFYQRSTSIER